MDAITVSYTTIKHAEQELDVYRHRMKLEGRNLDGKKKLSG